MCIQLFPDRTRNRDLSGLYHVLWAWASQSWPENEAAGGPSIAWRQTSPSTKTRRLSLSPKRKGRSAEPLQEKEMNRVCEGFTPAMLATTPPLSSSRFNLHDWSSGRADCPSVLLEKPSCRKPAIVVWFMVLEQSRAPFYCYNDIHERHTP